MTVGDEGVEEDAHGEDDPGERERSLWLGTWITAFCDPEKQRAKEAACERNGVAEGSLNEILVR